MFSSGNRFVCFHCHLPTPAYFINKKIKTTIMQTAQECLLLTLFLGSGHGLWVPGELPAPLPLAGLWCPSSRRAGQHGAGSRHGTTGRRCYLHRAAGQPMQPGLRSVLARGTQPAPKPPQPLLPHARARPSPGAARVVRAGHLQAEHGCGKTMR